MRVPETSPIDEDAAAGQSVVAAISNEMVRLDKEKFGRGPTRARTHWAGPDIVVAVLEDTLTTVERRSPTSGSTRGCATPACTCSTPA